MKIQSLIRENDRLVPVEVEISFIPGLPQIQFLGLPDQAIKESIHRIKSAIRAQGFEFPKAQQILVNLRPSHLKKSSRGLELAVALGLLWESGQAPKPNEESVLVYGELSLSGAVFEPDDLTEDFDSHDDHVVWTGTGSVRKTPFARACLKELRDLHEPLIYPAVAREYLIQRPCFGLDLKFPQRQAELLKLVALGEHSLLLAGPAGSGKSTLAKTLLSLLQEPSQEDFHEIFRNNKETKFPLSWRPLVHPHHSTSPLGLIGGGVPPFKGEFSRAHKGILVLDELLEFNPRAQEALREPMEEFRIRLRRGRFIEEHPAEALVVATTNLCPCGDWVPQSKVVCGRSLKKCQSYTERLSGPLVDRFQILFFTQKRETGESILGEDLLAILEDVRVFRRNLSLQDARFKKVASRWSWEELIQDLPRFYMEELFPKEMISRRRDLATLRVARSYADLDKSEKLEPQHVERALKVTYVPFEALKRLGC
ncbi:MAG: competence protein ComM [Bdellovibrio sp. ArHS]|uniref:ATP-binding protein n=1 Tax=Bdellovibrio sp. ArHS TaxID=1569284 RepID=UPI00058381F0|nr:ATP-binding protein [Bdellovibrio sp. ArHS]KHD89585.1 MAG: competence protein ComM [Bdellovibrio sp. ArHS]